jgi:hypothetical protein
MEKVHCSTRITRRVTRSFGKDITNGQVTPQPKSNELEYSDPIYTALVTSQPRFAPNPCYMDSQPELNTKMRAILFDWLVEVHIKFRLAPETLYIALNIVDRYVCIAEIARSRF